MTMKIVNYFTVAYYIIHLGLWLFVMNSPVIALPNATEIFIDFSVYLFQNCGHAFI